MNDLIVVGGGPAGLAAAIGAARIGMSVVVAEPRPYPIDKSCGEGLMPATVAGLQSLGVDDMEGYPFAGIRIVAGDASTEGNFKFGTGLGVRRTELSNALRGRAESVGVRFERFRVSDLSQDAESVEAGGLRARWLIAADGLHSRLRRIVGAPEKSGRRERWGVRAHFGLEPWTDRVEIYCADRGEAYVTPLADDLVGVALLTEEPGPFDELIRAHPELEGRLTNRVGSVRGAGPFPKWIDRKVYGRVLFVGDAAGFLDPLTGEGIQLGLRSACLAVNAIQTGRVGHYDRDWWRMSRPYWWITKSLVTLRRTRPLDRALVTVPNFVPGLLDSVLHVLGGAPQREPRST